MAAPYFLVNLMSLVAQSFRLFFLSLRSVAHRSAAFSGDSMVNLSSIASKAGCIRTPIGPKELGTTPRNTQLGVRKAHCGTRNVDGREKRHPSLGPVPDSKSNASLRRNYNEMSRDSRTDTLGIRNPEF
jgi:hypothetical protein